MCFIAPTLIELQKHYSKFFTLNPFIVVFLLPSDEGHCLRLYVHHSAHSAGTIYHHTLFWQVLWLSSQLTGPGSTCLTQLLLKGSDLLSWVKWLLSEHSLTSVTTSATRKRSVMHQPSSHTIPGKDQ